MLCLLISGNLAFGITFVVAGGGLIATLAAPQ